MKQDYNSTTEDKAFMHDELVKAKSINKTLMYELDQFKQKYGALDSN